RVPGNRNSRYPGRVYLIPLRGLSNTRSGFSAAINSRVMLPFPLPCLQLIFNVVLVPQRNRRDPGMSESITAARPVAGVPAAVGALDARRKLQLALAA